MDAFSGEGFAYEKQMKRDSHWNDAPTHINHYMNRMKIISKIFPEIAGDSHVPIRVSVYGNKTQW
jgi:hypothetical protein